MVHLYRLTEIDLPADTLEPGTYGIVHDGECYALAHVRAPVSSAELADLLEQTDDDVEDVAA